MIRKLLDDYTCACIDMEAWQKTDMLDPPPALTPSIVAEAIIEYVEGMEIAVNRVDRLLDVCSSTSVELSKDVLQEWFQDRNRLAKGYK